MTNGNKPANFDDVSVTIILPAALIVRVLLQAHKGMRHWATLKGTTVTPLDGSPQLEIERKRLARAIAYHGVWSRFTPTLADRIVQESLFGRVCFGKHATQNSKLPPLRSALTAVEKRARTNRLKQELHGNKPYQSKAISKEGAARMIASMRKADKRKQESE